jgi:SAM-dependent methyltransferase
MTSVPSAQSISEARYVRERTEPDLADFDYLHLSDLREGLREVLPARSGKVLDYGCGGSPYRGLLNCTTYHRADFPGAEGLDFVLNADTRIPAPAQNYDLILSTQVLEHVPDPQQYLVECKRLLRSGGRLVLSTHGTFHDHACPHDYWRWTADGLRITLERSGFRVSRLLKLTSGPRALLYLNRSLQPQLVFGRSSPLIWALRLNRLLYTRLNRRLLHQLSDREHRMHRVVPAGTPHDATYIALLALAELPGPADPADNDTRGN